MKVGEGWGERKWFTFTICSRGRKRKSTEKSARIHTSRPDLIGKKRAQKHLAPLIRRRLPSRICGWRPWQEFQAKSFNEAKAGQCRRPSFCGCTIKVNRRWATSLFQNRAISHPELVTLPATPEPSRPLLAMGAEVSWPRLGRVF